MINTVYNECENVMKTIITGGITTIHPVPFGTSEWYYGLTHEATDLFEAETLFQQGHAVKRNELCLIHYPDGAVYWPLASIDDGYLAAPVFLENSIYVLSVSFNEKVIRIYCFDCSNCQVSVVQELPLGIVKNCYNLQLHIKPLCLTRQGDDNQFEILWPETCSFELAPHESFFLRDEDKLYFNKWQEEGEGTEYRYWEETAVRDLQGNLMEVLPGDICIMPNGETWYIK